MARGSLRGAAGGRTLLAGSDPASPSAAANACSPRTATTARPAELAASGRWSASPSRSPARNAATSSVVTSPMHGPAPGGEHAVYRSRSRR